MEFNDPDLRLEINDLSFKAYLEDSDITYETKDQQLPFVPTSYTNDSMAIRVSERAKFTFNVFSETRAECVENYNNLQNLLNTIKPIYSYVNDQIVPNTSNVTGLITLAFKGLPTLSRDSMRLHLSNFSYSLNKDLGYIHVPVSEIKSGEPKFYDQDNMKLIPIGYKISLEGKVLLQFNQTANFTNKKTTDLSSVEEQNKIQNKFDNLQKIKSDSAKQLVTEGFLDKDGNIINQNKINDQKVKTLFNSYQDTQQQLQQFYEQYNIVPGRS